MRAYRVRTTNAQKGSLLKYVGLRENAPLPPSYCDPRALVALAEKIEQKAILQAQLYDCICPISFSQGFAAQ